MVASFPSRPILTAVAAIVLMMLLAPQAAADGKLFGRASVVVPIPDQEALIHFDKGIETLVIETRFTPPDTSNSPQTTDQPAFAWVVPIPGQGPSGGPPEVSATTRGVFPTLRALFQPRVIARAEEYWPPVVGLSAIMLALCLIQSFRRRWASAFALIVLTCAVVFVLMPSLGRARSAAIGAPTIDGVAILDRSFVGSFDVTIVGAEPGSAPEQAGVKLAAWLKDNGFSMPAGVEPVLADYAKRGWVFVASRLHAPESGVDRPAPHPLVFRFKAAEPVYPLMLTGVGNGDLAVDLYVFGSGKAEADGFECKRCTKPKFGADAVTNLGWRDVPGVGIAHEQLMGLIPPCEAATKLSAVLSPAQMTRDATIRFTDRDEVGDVVYSREAAITTAADRGSLVLIASSLALTLLCLVSRPKPAVARQGAAAVVCISVLFGFGWYSTLSTAEVRHESYRTSIVRWRSESLEGALIKAIDNQRKANPEFRPTVDWVRTAIRAAAVEDFGKGAADALVEGDEPYGYMVMPSTRPDTVEVLWFDAVGAVKPWVWTFN